MKSIALVEVSHWHAGFYANAFQKAGANIVGVSSTNQGFAEKYAKELSCEYFLDYFSMIEMVKPDFLMAMGKHIDMPDIVKDLLSIGIPFGIEKPIGINARDIEQLAEEATRKGTFIAVPLVNRYSLLWEQLSKLEQAGRVGTRLHSHFRIINGIPQRYEKMNAGWMLHPELSGGGCLRNLGIHAADAFIHFSNSNSFEVIGSTISHRIHNLPVEEMGAALVISDGGIIGTLEAGYSYATREAGGDFEWRVSASNCYLVDRQDTLEITTLDDGMKTTIPNISSAERYEKFGKDTLDRLSSGRKPIASIEECYRAMLLLDDIYAKAVCLNSEKNHSRR